MQGCTRHCICGCAEGAEWSDGDGRAVWGGAPDRKEFVLWLSIELLHWKVRSLKFFFLFAHKGGDRQRSKFKLPVAGKGASLLYIGALVLKGAMMGGAGMFVGAKAVLRFRDSLLLCSSYETFGIEFCFL